jgi:hypothetical protein
MSDKYFPQKPELSPTIYAYRILGMKDKEWLLKVGYTTRDAKSRIDEQTKTAWIKYEILIEESAVRSDWSTFSDFDLHKYLKKQWYEHIEGEWFKCEAYDVRAAIIAVKNRQENEENRTLDFGMRPEQVEAVEKTARYYTSSHNENGWNRPHFLWNAKMRFWKTFATYQLALKMWWKKVLVLTFKPAVESAWQEDLMRHVDFEGWQFISKNHASIEDINTNNPFVCFWSFQDFLGKNSAGWIKPKNEWVHTTHRDAIVFDEYHYGARRDGAKWLFDDETEDENETDDLAKIAFKEWVKEAEQIIPITTNHYLYLSWTPFRAIWSWEFIEEQIFNRTYSDEQRAKEEWNLDNNPYDSLPKMVMMTYQMPESIKHIAQWWEFDEFDLNVFFQASWKWNDAKFAYEEYVQKRLDLIRWSFLETTIDNLKLWAKKPAFPFSDSRLLNILTHTFWFLPSVASCYAMKNLMMQRQNTFYQDYEIVVAAGNQAGIGVKALEPVQKAMWDPLKTKTITLSTWKLTTWVSVKPWSWVLMLRNLKSPETYFQTAFRAQTPWVVYNPDWTNPNHKEILKQICYIFDFAPNRALSQIADYSNKLDPKEPNPEKKVAEFIKFLPVLAYDGSSMKEIDAVWILDIVTSGTTATLLARRRESALLVNVDNDTLARLMANERAMQVLMSIEWFRALNQDIETIINKSESVKKSKQEANEHELTKSEKKQLSDDEKEYKSKRKEIQQKLIKFATRIPVFMYLTDYRERSLKDVITQLEPELFKKVTGLTVQDFELLVSLNIFNDVLMNDAVYKFKRYEDASLEYAWINRHEWQDVWWYDTVISRNEYESLK